MTGQYCATFLTAIFDVGLHDLLSQSQRHC